MVISRWANKHLTSRLLSLSRGWTTANLKDAGTVAAAKQELVIIWMLGYASYIKSILKDEGGYNIMRGVCRFHMHAYVSESRQGNWLKWINRRSFFHLHSAFQKTCHRERIGSSNPWRWGFRFGLFPLPFLLLRVSEQEKMIFYFFFYLQ